MTANHDPKQWLPPWRNLPLEARVMLEYARMPRSLDTALWPRGEQQPVLVIPGFGQSDRSTAPLRAILNKQGFVSHGWNHGKNLGLKPGMTSALLQQINALYDQHQTPVALVGWSLGGVLARELARKCPDRILRVISLGSPLAGGHSTTLQALFDLLNRSQGPGHVPERYAPPAVRCTAVYSRQDGIVNWRASREPETPLTENIEVKGSHMGLGFNPAVWHIVCHRLSPTTCNEPYSAKPK